MQERKTVAASRHRSFSASSRNESGTDRDAPNRTDPYPTASHPKRSRILSMARSAVQRKINQAMACADASVQRLRQVHDIAGQCPATDVLFADATRALPAFRIERLERDTPAPRSIHLLFFVTWRPVAPSRWKGLWTDRQRARDRALIRVKCRRQSAKAARVAAERAGRAAGAQRLSGSTTRASFTRPCACPASSSRSRWRR